MNRRSFGRLLLGASGGLHAAGSAWSIPRAPEAERAEPSEVFYYLDDRRAVEALGRAFLKAGGQPGQMQSFDRLTASMQADFCDGRTLTWRGWVISRTEAELAAALYLDAAR